MVAVLEVPGSLVLQILRNATGRVDKNDPAFTDDIMYDYLNMFLQGQHPTEARLFEDNTWWDFTIGVNSPDPYPVNLDAEGFSTIGPAAYIAYPSPTFNTFKLFWYEDPTDFYYRWPWHNTFTPQMPTYVLYYDNTLTFRGPPDQSYDVRIQAKKIKIYFTGGNLSAPDVPPGTGESTMVPAYLARYMAYGAALDILSDYGEMDKYNEIFPVYRRYKGQVMARTWDQLNSERTGPDF